MAASIRASDHDNGDEVLQKETFTGEAVTRVGERGLSWQGVRVACRLSHKDWSWLALEAEYLTLPGSNLIAIVTRWTNHSAARMQMGTGVMAWLQPGGTRANTVAHWTRGGERMLQRRGVSEMTEVRSPGLRLRTRLPGMS